MADVMSCPVCKATVSRRTFYCRSCGMTIGDVPQAVTPELIGSLLDDDVPDFMFQYAHAVFNDLGFVTPRPETLALVPKRIGAGYSLVVLDSEVRNGGFYQWFTNSSGMIARETLEALRLIGAERQFELVQRAIRLNDRLETKYPEYRDRWLSDDGPGVCGADAELRCFWTDFEPNFLTEFNRMSGEFYSLEDAASLWNPFSRYVREHVDECTHRRG